MSEKIENLLNLALEATEEERMESGELGAGYDPVEREWELIVKYSGEAELIRQTAVSVTELLGGYAVIVIKESRIEELAALDGGGIHREAEEPLFSGGERQAGFLYR